MKCQKCGSGRIMNVSADFDPRWRRDGHSMQDHYILLNGEYLDDNIPNDLGISKSAADIDFNLCLDCGQMQGTWPLDKSQFEKNMENGNI